MPPASLVRSVLLACALACLCETPSTAVALPPPSPPPPPAPPVGSWSKSDSGEAIVLDIQFDFYAMYQSFFVEAFVASVGEQLAVPPFSIYVSNFARSSHDTTVVFFNTLLHGTSSSSSEVLLEQFLEVQVRPSLPPPSPRA